MAKRKKPKGGWSSSENQWKTPQSTRKGPGCGQATAIVVLSGLAGVAFDLYSLAHLVV